MARPTDTGESTYDVTFINVSHPGQLRQRDTQKVIRQRVMRDIGKSRRKRSRPITVSIEMPPSKALDDILHDNGIKEGSGVGWSSSFAAISKSLQPYGYFAVVPNARARQLFHFMHGAAGNVYRPFRMEWFAMAIADRCAFYLCLANGALFYHQMTQGGGFEYSDCEESSEYFSHCTSMMAQRLSSGEDGVSEGVITTVLGFLCHDASVGKWDRWLIHMDGLHRIVQLRHGFSGLTDHTHLFAFWFDMTGCAIHDAMPRIAIPPGLPQASVLACEVSSSLSSIMSELTKTRSQPLLQACSALEQTALVAAFINKNCHKSEFWQGGINTTRLLGPAAHYALSIPRATAQDHSRNFTGAEALCEMVRLALLVFIARLKKVFWLDAGEMASFQYRFESLLPVAIEISGICPELCLWSMVVVACSHTQPRPPPLVAAIRDLKTRLEFTSREAIDVGRSLIWVDAVIAAEAEVLILEMESISTTNGT